MLRFLPLALLIIAAPAVQAQTCSGPIILTTQAEVDAFSCEVVEGSLDIQQGPDDPITDLHGLDELRIVEQQLYIWGTSALVDLDGLSQLERVGGTLDVQGNDALESLDWLADLDSLGGLLVSGNPVLRNIDALATVGPVIGDVAIMDNDSLRTLDGLSGLAEIGELYVQGNASLENVDGLRGLRSIYGLYLTGNPALADCSCGLGPLFLTPGSGPFWPPTLSGNAAGCTSREEIVDGFGYADCPTCVGPTRLRHQADADALTCPVVYGSLYVGGRGSLGPDSLAALSGLHTVQGDLVVQGTPLTSLRGLDGLQHVWGDVDIAFNPDLRRLGSLDALGEIGGGLRLEENQKLARIDGLRALATMPGDILITDHDSLQALDGFDALERVEGNLTLADLPAVTMLDGLAGLRSVGGSFDLLGLRRLERLDALAALDSVGADLRIRGSENSSRWPLQSVSGLSEIDHIGGRLNIANTDSLRDIDAFGRITDLPGSLGLYENHHLEAVSGLESLRSTGGLSVVSNYRLPDLGGFAALESIDGDLVVQNNSDLEHLDGLANLTHVPGNLWIDINPGLRSIDGLRNVTAVGGELRLRINERLPNVDGLGQVRQVGGRLDVSDNELLADCDCGLYPLLSEGEVGGTIAIYGNAAGCASIEEVDEPASGACPSETSAEPVAPLQPVRLAAFPNPAARHASFRFVAEVAGEARLAVYDVLGREVAVLLDGPAAGVVERRLEAPLPAGVYVARLVTAGGREESVRFTVVR